MRFVKSYLPVFVWMLVIFIMSGEAGSTEKTSHFIRKIVLWAYPAASPDTIHLVTVIARKGAHLSEYALLAALIWVGRRRQLQEGLVWRAGEARLIILICALYAATDEFHQSFVILRQGAVMDVAIDSTGAILALLAIYALCRCVANRPRPPKRL